MPPRPRPPRPPRPPGPRPRARSRTIGYPAFYPVYPPEVQVLEVERVVEPKAPAAPFRIVSKIFEEGISFPVVTHVFSGMSVDQAQGFYRAHLKSDAFLRGCSAGKFGSMRCREEHYAEKWNGQKWSRA
jgi:hypothetical protein